MCIALIQGNEKCLMKFAAVSAKTLKIVKCLPNIFISIYIVDLRLLSCFRIFFKRQLECVIQVFMSQVVPAKLKISGPIDA